MIAPWHELASRPRSNSPGHPIQLLVCSMSRTKVFYDIFFDKPKVYSWQLYIMNVKRWALEHWDYKIVIDRKWTSNNYKYRGWNRRDHSPWCAWPLISLYKRQCVHPRSLLVSKPSPRQPVYLSHSHVWYAPADWFKHWLDGHLTGCWCCVINKLGLESSSTHEYTHANFLPPFCSGPLWSRMSLFRLTALAHFWFALLCKDI